MGGYTQDSTAGDSLSFHNGMKFSAPDEDNDTENYSCSKMWKGAYWYNNCHYSNPLGLYKTPTSAQGVVWFTFNGDLSLDKIKFLLLPK